MARNYSSELRTERARINRDAVLLAAHEMFISTGWVATTVAGVARAAGVTRQTVYQQFESKLTLLDACIDLALTDGRLVPVRDMPEYQHMAQGDRSSRVAAGAQWLRGAHERSAAIQDVLDQAAVTDTEAAARLADRENTRWNEVRWAASLILGHEPDNDTVDALWTLTSRRVWLMLVRDRDWDGHRWDAWFVQQAGALLDSP
ncbi:helix-turn-helix domain-containing protein [Williamsia sp.]|uniref:TetR/AcrR family transcriptional regulator n=1 Tax=Williamsia sp. TaxID=1872085 RepID=UPI002F92A743